MVTGVDFDIYVYIYINKSSIVCDESKDESKDNVDIAVSPYCLYVSYLILCNA